MHACGRNIKISLSYESSHLYGSWPTFFEIFPLVLSDRIELLENLPYVLFNYR